MTPPEVPSDDPVVVHETPPGASTANSSEGSNETGKSKSLTFSRKQIILGGALCTALILVAGLLAGVELKSSSHPVADGTLNQQLVKSRQHLAGGLGTYGASGDSGTGGAFGSVSGNSGSIPSDGSTAAGLGNTGQGDVFNSQGGDAGSLGGSQTVTGGGDTSNSGTVGDTPLGNSGASDSSSNPTASAGDSAPASQGSPTPASQTSPTTTAANSQQTPTPTINGSTFTFHVTTGTHQLEPANGTALTDGWSDPGMNVNDWLCLDFFPVGNGNSWGLDGSNCTGGGITITASTPATYVVNYRVKYCHATDNGACGPPYSTTYDQMDIIVSQ
jgi:hypothetical protein